MAKGDYRGGSTVVGPGSGWFSREDPEVAREEEAQALHRRLTWAERAVKESLGRAKQFPKKKKIKKMSEAKKAARLSKRLEKSAERGPASPTKSEVQQQARMAKVIVEKKRK